jgi:acetoin utilization deacetylase AcuC-like enzyme
MHPESPARLKAIQRALASSPLEFSRLNPRPVTREELLRVHHPEHIDAMEYFSLAGKTYPDPDVILSEGSWLAAQLAAGSVITACDAVLKGEVDNVFCAVRPPGHHAEHDRAMGFCMFNNVAVAARWLREEAGLARVAILDWDLHHGNGTQNTFYDDDSVYYVSLHEHPNYPGSGDPAERGKNDTNLNVRMNVGDGPEQWLAALDTKVIPELERFNPEFLILSCGFDAHKGDPLGGQKLETKTFAEMTQRIRSLAGGRIVSVLEGGYDIESLGQSALAHVTALAENPVNKAAAI